MLTLYYKPTCPFCQRVLGEAEDMGIKLDLKDISSDPVLADELIERGGKRMVPYLVDADRNVEMYESGDIVAYFAEHYKDGTGASDVNGLKVHKSDDEVCDTCQ
ncbi:MAG: glutaredoxin 3 [Patiriisocius sp.]|jgi:glutaredoxin 3